MFVGKVLTHKIQSHLLAMPFPFVADCRIEERIGLVRGLRRIRQDRLVAHIINTAGDVSPPGACLA